MHEMVRIAGIAAPQRWSRLMPRLHLVALLIVALAVAAVTPAAIAQQQPPAEPPMSGAASPSPLQPGDAFGEPVTLPPRTILYLKGHTNWDAAFDTLVDAFKSLNEYLDKQGIKADGPAMTL